MSIMEVSGKKKRFTQAEGKRIALEAARDLLLEIGPQAVTLKAVAARMGRTHANLLHHFGTAADLQKELAAMIAGRLARRIGDAVIRVRNKEADPFEIVDLTFDAFDKEGVGPLAGWMILTGNRDVLDPILKALHDLIEGLHVADERVPLHRNTLSLVLTALGHSLLGQEFAQALHLPPETAREMAVEHLRLSIAQAKADKARDAAMKNGTTAVSP